MTVHYLDVQEEFCFGEENVEVTAAVASFKAVVVNITRSSPACGAASISLNLAFKNGEIPVCK